MSSKIEKSTYKVGFDVIETKNKTQLKDLIDFELNIIERSWEILGKK